MKKIHWIALGVGLSGSFALGKIIARCCHDPIDIDDDNAYLYSSVSSDKKKNDYIKEKNTNFYKKYGKCILDNVLSFGGLMILSPLYGAISLAIQIDDPGPVFFTQKRVGKDKHFFMLHKFRSMKMSAPHDVPTHQLSNPEQYITRVGKILRRTSLDELPQIWDIFRGKMSIIGPRPALWNQADLIAEREKYGANNVMPGLTGLAQISGRDELEITDKARLDGKYCQNISLWMDSKCFMGTIASVLRHDGIVEGGTGRIHQRGTEMYKKDYEQNNVRFPLRPGVPVSNPETEWGFQKHFEIDKNRSVKVLITGSGSYIGESFKAYAKEHYPSLRIDTISVRGDAWRDFDFSTYDTVFHVAGIAHADVGKVTEREKEEYYEVNTDLALEIARKAKEAGVKQFVLMSSMIVYGSREYIDEHTVPYPENFYGDSKWQADKGARALSSESFKVAVLRSPMIYGKNCKGNYPLLSQIAKKVPVFPSVNNQRSMLYIENLCEFISLLVLSGESGVYFPQNNEYSNTSDIVKMIANFHNKKIFLFRTLSVPVMIAKSFPGRIGKLSKKAFGTSYYAQEISTYKEMNYQFVSIPESIKQTEGKAANLNNVNNVKKKALVVASVASMIDQFNISNIKILISMGYEVDVATNFIKGSTCTEERIEELLRILDGLHVDCYQIEFNRNVSDLKSDIVAFRQLDDVVKGRAKTINKNKYHRVSKEKPYIFIHSHSPIGGVIGRIIAKKNGIKNIYTAHGFHFYDGAPLKNWILYYPVEKLLSRWTDVLITINRKDYQRARDKFYAQRTAYIPGIGIDTEYFKNCTVSKSKKRAGFNIPEKAFILLSVGELSVNKNQKIVIDALYKIQNQNIYYLIVGKGPLFNKYKEIIEKYKLEKNIILLGYRRDIGELCKIADCFVHPSIREGLGIAPLEAMACGLPLISTYQNGMRDYTEDKISGFCLQNPFSIKEMVDSIQKMYDDTYFRKRCGMNNLETVKRFDISVTNQIMYKIYHDI